MLDRFGVRSNRKKFKQYFVCGNFPSNSGSILCTILSSIFISMGVWMSYPNACSALSSSLTIMFLEICHIMFNFLPSPKCKFYVGTTKVANGTDCEMAWQRSTWLDVGICCNLHVNQRELLWKNITRGQN